MKKLIGYLAIVGLAACAPATRINPVAGTQPADYSFLYTENFPNGQPAQKIVTPAELDVRSCDISAWDFSAYSAEELADVLNFDSKTKFPPKSKMPKGFSAKKLLKKSQNPGLGVRALHKKGITGKGVSVVIVDQSLLLDHEQYADRLHYYWQDPVYQQYADGEASMHGPAVTSILAGKTVGVAPQADIYYWAGKFEKTKNTFNARPIAEVLNRILRYNFQLAPEKQIRVVSISRGFDDRDEGAQELQQAVKELAEHNIAVFTTNDVAALSRSHGLTDPDSADYCRPMTWKKTERLSADYASFNEPLAPMDFRATAAPNGVRDYAYYTSGGLSWVVPYVAGLYALGVQVYPDLTKEAFMQAVRETSTTKNCTYRGNSFTAYNLVNPQKLMEYLKKLNVAP